jgi:hypothetical protein
MNEPLRFAGSPTVVAKYVGMHAWGGETDSSGSETRSMPFAGCRSTSSISERRKVGWFGRFSNWHENSEGILQSFGSGNNLVGPYFVPMRGV